MSCLPKEREGMELSDDELVYLFYLAQKGAQFAQRDHVGAVAQGAVGVGMNFQKEGVYADGKRRPGEWMNEPAVASARRAAPSGHLDAVRGVEHNRHSERPHER